MSDLEHDDCGCQEYNTLSRRHFVMNAAGAAVFTAAIPDWLPRVVLAPAASSRDIIVYVFMRGGADALSLCVPWGDTNYYAGRSTIAIPRPDASGTSAELTLRYSNENVFPLAVQTTSGSLYLNNTYVGKFEQSDAVGLTKLGNATGKATLVVEKPAEFQSIIKDTASASIAYRLASKLRLEIGEDKVTIKSESSGQIDRAQMTAEPAK